MAPVPESRGHRYRVTIPNRRLAAHRLRRLLWHLQALWCFYREQNPSCQRPREEVLKYLCSENWQLSTRPPRFRYSFDSDKCQILLCFYLPFWFSFCFVCYFFGLTSNWLVTLFSPATSAAFVSTVFFSSSDRTGPFSVT